MKFFTDFLKQKDELKFEIAVVESLNSAVKYIEEIQKKNENKIIYTGKFKVDGRDFSFKLEVHPKDRISYFSFSAYVAHISTIGSLNILTPRQTLSVFSTIKDILIKHIDEFDQLEYDAADEKLLKFYIALASSHFPDFKHLISGLRGTLTKNTTSRKMNTKFEIKKENE
jgi:hypothetical protein